MPWYVPLFPMTSAAFVLFTNYMIPDPATTPITTWGQILFGLACAAGYAILLSNHVVHALFLSLVLVCGIRGVYLHIYYWLNPPVIPVKGDKPAAA
jgi:Na+-translocating ferredoxin:NAD+ oxidoreductase RnfD subunit